MAYQALYRKWRPINFDDMIGQEHITKTLKNQIISGRTSHAYIFTGIRGTGKTSTAKVFSRAINCTNPQNGNPCNECETCKGILSGSILDVSEIDAASNNGVDSIRDIREELVYSALQSTYKVYIIDEVHMLSTGAFNALLKTLEEPPQNVLFILATTDIHKVPETILSRCQRFDFRRITADDIAKHLKKVTLADNITVDDEGLRLVSRLAEGSMRDALSIMDRCLAYGENTLSYKDIVNILGVAEDKQAVEILKGIADNNTGAVISALNELLACGKSIDIIINGLISTARNIMLCKSLKNAEEVLDVDSEFLSELKTAAENFTEEKCIFTIKCLSETASEIKFSPSPRISLEICLVKLCNPAYIETPESLVDRISSLENKIEKGEFKTVVKEVIKEEEKHREPKPKTVKIQPQGSFADTWKNVLKVLCDENPALYSVVSQFEATGEGEVLVLLYMSDDFGGCQKLVLERKEEFFNVIEKVCGIRPARCVFQKKVIENATTDKLEELAKLNLKTI